MNKIIVVFLLSISIFPLSSMAVLIDTQSNSFIDLDTNLEWMDFGINNHQTFYRVKNATRLGGEYYGWTVATESQMRELLLNAFLDSNPMIYRPGQKFNRWGEAIDWTEDESTFSTLWDPIFSIMGYNTILRPGDDAEQRVGLGYYESDNGYLYRAQFVDYTNVNHSNAEREFYDSVSLITYDYFEHRNSYNIAFSTMLVKSANKVPEPSMLSILILFLIALVAIKNVSYKNGLYQFNEYSSNKINKHGLAKPVVPLRKKHWREPVI